MSSSVFIILLSSIAPGYLYIWVHDLTKNIKIHWQLETKCFCCKVFDSMALMVILKFKYYRFLGLFQYDTIMNAEIKLEIFFMVCPIIICIEKLKYFKLISGNLEQLWYIMIYILFDIYMIYILFRGPWLWTVYLFVDSFIYNSKLFSVNEIKWWSRNVKNR